MRILMAEDNKDIIEVMTPHFKKLGFSVDYAYDGEEAISLYNRNYYDLLLLDIMMPKIDGFAVCKMVRKNSDIPIIMITAKVEDEDFITGIELGADDYILKPFNPMKVIIKIKALMRRLKIQEKENVIILDNLEIDLEKYIVKIENEKLKLTKKEIEILFLLAKRPEQIFTREILLDQVWGEDYFGELRAVDSHIKRLRSKLNHYKTNWTVKTVWGVGYKIEKVTE